MYILVCVQSSRRTDGPIYRSNKGMRKKQGGNAIGAFHSGIGSFLLSNNVRFLNSTLNATLDKSGRPTIEGC